MSKKKMALLIAVCLVLTGVFSAMPIQKVSAGIQATYYVSPTGNNSTGNGSISSPWETITKARDVVRTINGNMTGDIYVYLRGGTYTLTDSIVLGPSDSGTNGYSIIYRAYNSEIPVISGGQSLTGGWTLHDSGKNIYKKTSVNWSFRQLYVGGKWGIRARYPNLVDEQNGGNYFSMSDTTYPFDISSSNIGSWANNGVCEFVWIGHWSQNRGRINSYTIDGGIATVYFKSPENNFAVNHHNQNPGYYYFENAYDLIDAEGEWFLDTPASTLYYKPRSGEDMSSVEVIAPKVESSLIKIEGTSTSVVARNVQFYGITLRHNNWTAPNSYGYVNGQAGHFIQTSSTGSVLSQATMSPVPGMVNIKYANNIRIERSKFTLGGSWGIMEQAGSNNNTYIGNEFSYLALGAIAVGNTIDPCGFWSLPAGTAAYDVIKNNLIHSVGYYYRDAVGILALKSKYVTIENNEIRNVPYSGISVGFEWNDSGDQDSSNNKVRYNRIHSAMQLHYDGGGTYTLGKMTNSNFEYNFLHNIVRSNYGDTNPNPVVGTYLDCGSSYMTYENNVGDQTTWFTVSIGPVPIHDNIGRYNHYNTSFVGYTDGYSTWTPNTSSYGTQWAQKAKDIMDNAGIEPSYRNIGSVTLGRNLAVEGTASASSTLDSSYAASNANDNNCETGIWASDASQTNPWWQVDLGAAYRLYEIDIVARQDMDQESSRKNFAIRVSNDSSFGSYTQIASVGDTVAFPNKGIYSAVVNNSNAFRYVRIQRINSTGHLTLAECKVYGTFSPPSSSNLKLWLKADDGVTKDGSNYVSTWADKSGSGNDAVQSTTGKKPVWVDKAFNDKPAVQFDGVDDHIVASGVSGTYNPFTVLFVIKPSSLKDYNHGLGATGGWGKFWWHGSADGRIFTGTDVSSRIVTNTGVLVNSTVQQFTYKFSSSSAVLYKNGTQINTATQNTPASWTGFILGQDSTYTIDGFIPEVMIYNKALTDAERQNAENYLKIKYGY